VRRSGDSGAENKTERVLRVPIQRQELEREVPSPLMLDHIVRKFLLHCHGQFLELTSSPVLAKISQLHNELQLASEVLTQHKVPPVIISYCDMIVAETYDLYNSEFAKTVNRDYWDAGQGVEVVIDQLLTKEIEKIRLLCKRSSERPLLDSPKAQCILVIILFKFRDDLWVRFPAKTIVSNHESLLEQEGQS
jgi:hypothetical protein